MSLAGTGDIVFKYRDLLVPLAFLLVFVPGPRLAGDPIAPLLVGALLAALGQVLRALTIGLEYVVRGGRNRRVYAEGLVTGGIYAHTRNPMYVGNMLILGGIALVSNSWVCFALAVPLAAFVYCAIVAAEERFLRSRFGSGYEAYADTVPRWSLRFAGLAGTLRGGQFHWRRLLVKEYGTTTASIVTLCAAAWIAFARTGGAMPGDVVRVTLVSCAVAAIAFWCTVRWLKKSRTVVAD